MNRRNLIPIAFAILALIIVRSLSKDVEFVGILLSMGLGAGLGLIVKSIIFKEN